jgi:hypothetical protein
LAEIFSAMVCHFQDMVGGGNSGSPDFLSYNGVRRGFICRQKMEREKQRNGYYFVGRVLFLDIDRSRRFNFAVYGARNGIFDDFFGDGNRHHNQ